MKKTSLMSTVQPESVAVLAGEQCPKTGWWHPLQSEEPRRTTPSRFVGKGSVLPAVSTAITFWVPSHNAYRQTDY